MILFSAIFFSLACSAATACGSMASALVELRSSGSPLVCFLPLLVSFTLLLHFAPFLSVPIFYFS
jgi:hypothetical protein